jgi:DNA invertase Pin-like site-specific DNA recombinase
LRLVGAGYVHRPVQDASATKEVLPGGQRIEVEGESAKTADRTELQNLLQYCRANKGRVQFVVVFNLTRFARI